MQTITRIAISDKLSNMTWNVGNLRRLTKEFRKFWRKLTWGQQQLNRIQLTFLDKEYFRSSTPTMVVAMMKKMTVMMMMREKHHQCQWLSTIKLLCWCCTGDEPKNTIKQRYWFQKETVTVSAHLFFLNVYCCAYFIFPIAVTVVLKLSYALQVSQIITIVSSVTRRSKRANKITLSFLMRHFVHFTVKKGNTPHNDMSELLHGD